VIAEEILTQVQKSLMTKLRNGIKMGIDKLVTTDAEEKQGDAAVCN